MAKHPTEKELFQAVRTILLGIGEDPEREGLRDTPRRFISALREMTIGAGLEEEKVLTTLFDSERFDQMIVLSDIQFQSTCEHHLLPFMGRADVGYLPGDEEKIIGISKLARLVDLYSRRLQNQERITRQIADGLKRRMNPRGIAVVLTAEHSCIACRGIRRPGSKMQTSIMEGAFRYNEGARMEFFELCRRGRSR